MDDYKIIVEQEHQTVAAHYEVEPKPAEGQSEAALEKSLIKQLQGQGPWFSGYITTYAIAVVHSLRGLCNRRENNGRFF